MKCFYEMLESNISVFRVWIPTGVSDKMAGSAVSLTVDVGPVVITTLASTLALVLSAKLSNETPSRFRHIIKVQLTW